MDSSDIGAILRDSSISSVDQLFASDPSTHDGPMHAIRCELLQFSA
jgi:hypothetical protein